MFVYEGGKKLIYRKSVILRFARGGGKFKRHGSISAGWAVDLALLSRQKWHISGNNSC